MAVQTGHEQAWIMACEIEAAGGCPGRRWPRKKIHPRHGGAASHVSAVQTALFLRLLDQPSRPPLGPSQNVVVRLPSDSQAAQDRVGDLHHLRSLSLVVDGDAPTDIARAIRQRCPAGYPDVSPPGARKTVIHLERLNVLLPAETVADERPGGLLKRLRVLHRAGQVIEPEQSGSRRACGVSDAQKPIADRHHRAAVETEPHGNLIVGDLQSARIALPGDRQCRRQQPRADGRRSTTCMAFR